VVCTRKTICFLRDHGRMMVMSTSSVDNMHGVEDDNSNPYRTMTFPLRFQHLWIEFKKIQFGTKM